MTFPNILSMIRIVLIPVYASVYLSSSSKGSLIAGIILIASGITDVLDGFIARKFNQSSEIGKILDPLADKLTQITVMICLCVNYFKYIWPLFAYILFKEILMLTVGYFMVKKKGFVYSSMWFGKLTTLSLYAAVTAFTIFPSLEGDRMRIISAILIGMLAFSLLGYGSYLLTRTAKADLGYIDDKPDKVER